MRDRLIEILLQKMFGDQFKNTARQQAENLADHLLANGVIVPPCKVRDAVYYIPFGNHIVECKVAQIVIEPFEKIEMSFHCYGGIAFDMRHIGETVFLTKEEAEKALAERSKE